MKKKAPIDDTKVSEELSDETKEWIRKNNEREDEISKWKDETDYEYRKNVDIINNTIDTTLRKSIDSWYENYKNKDIINKDKLVEIIDKIEYKFMLPESVELETEVKYTEQVLSDNLEYCIIIHYKFIMDDKMLRQEKWKFDITDIIRGSKIDWLFD